MPNIDGRPLEERVAVLERALQDHVGHHSQIHAMEAEALTLRTVELERRLAEMNLFREQISQERAKYVSRENYEERHDALITRISAMELLSSNIQGRMYMIGAVISVITSLVVVAVNLVIKFWR